MDGGPLMAENFKARIQLGRTMGADRTWHLRIEDQTSGALMVEIEIPNDQIGDFLAGQSTIVPGEFYDLITDRINREIEIEEFFVPGLGDLEEEHFGHDSGTGRDYITTDGKVRVLDAYVKTFNSLPDMRYGDGTFAPSDGWEVDFPRSRNIHTRTDKGVRVTRRRYVKKGG